MKIGERQLTHEEDMKITPSPPIFLTYAGSISHGTVDPTNPHTDIDIKGVFVAPLNHYLGFNAKNPGKLPTFRGQLDNIDSELHEVRKFCQLALDCNPTVLEMLYVDPALYIHKPAWPFSSLVEQRHRFLSIKAFYTFLGYAHDQYRKMEAEVTNRDMGEKRKRLVQLFGYDTKNAAHLLRLLWMGKELLTEGAMTVKRPEAEFLKQIRNGLLTLDQVKKLAEEQFKEFEPLKEKTSLPEHPDREWIEHMLHHTILKYHSLIYDKW